MGSIGRPDLLEEAAGQTGTAEPGARDLFQSIQKFFELPDYLQVWPSHGAGSACGKGLGAVPSSTVGYEKLFNEALQFQSGDEFVQYILMDQPEAPPYFGIMKHVNKHGPEVMGLNALPPKLDVASLNSTKRNQFIIDTRASRNFAQQHAPRTINIPTKNLAQHGGWFIDYDQPLYLIVDEGAFQETIRVLREIGVDNIVGYFDANEMIQAGLATESFEYRSPSEVADAIEGGSMQLVDVRRKTEWNESRIPYAKYSFLGNLINEIKSFDDEQPIVFQCRTGGRSAVACSLAQASGFKSVINLEGGIESWQREGFPLVKENSGTVV